MSFGEVWKYSLNFLNFSFPRIEAGRDIGVYPGGEALDKIDITVGQRTYVFQGTRSQILDHLKKNPKQAIRTISLGQDGKWKPQGDPKNSNVIIRIQGINTQPTELHQIPVLMIQKGVFEAAGNMVASVKYIGQIKFLTDKATTLLGISSKEKTITVSLDAYQKKEELGRGAFGIIAQILTNFSRHDMGPHQTQ